VGGVRSATNRISTLRSAVAVRGSLTVPLRRWDPEHQIVDDLALERKTLDPCFEMAHVTKALQSHGQILHLSWRRIMLEVVVLRAAFV